MSANNICLYLTGKKPQTYDPSNNSITINAAGNNIQANRSNSCFITPMRNTSFSDALYYDPSSGEITFDASGGDLAGDASGVEYWIYDGNNNFYGPSGNTLTAAAITAHVHQIAMGDEALSAGSGGNLNVGVGWRAGHNTINGGAVVIGARATGNNNWGAGTRSTIVGADGCRYSGYGLGDTSNYNTTGGYAAMRGTAAAVDVSPGDDHTAIGYEAMVRVGDGDGLAVDEKSVAVGAQALVRGGVENVGLGYRALYYTAVVGASTRPYYNVAVGARCMGGIIDATDISFNNNVAVGYESLWRSTVWNGAARSNIAIGYRASYDITPTDISHTIVINATGEALNPQDSSRCYIKPISAGSGDDILYYDPSWGEITYGTDSSKDVNWWEFDANNNFYGPDTDKSFTTGTYNVACGVGALAQNTTGDYNVAIGYNAYNLGNATGGCAVGYEALATSTSGGTALARLAIGSKAMAKAPGIIAYAVAIGYRALEDPASGASDRTTAIGYEADASGGAASSDDPYCVYIGSKCRRWGTTNTGRNVVIGYGATSPDLDEYRSTHVGYEANTTNSPYGTSLGYKSAGRQWGVAIGFEAGISSGGIERAIILNAQDISLNATANDSLFVKPIRNASSANALYYDTSTYEITYGADHSDPPEEWWKFDGNDNFYGPSGNVMGTAVLGNTNKVICGYDISGDAIATGGVAVGREAGLFERAVAIGYRALSATNATWAGANEGKGTVALGSFAGETTATSELSNYNTFVGYEAGYASSGMYGEYNVALGYKASCGATFDASYSIVINATGAALVPQDSSRCFIKPIRNDASYNSIQSLHYDPSWGEITYDLDYIPSATAAEGRADALVTQLDPSQNPLLDNSGSKGMMWVNQVQDASGWDYVALMDISRQALGCAALGGKIYAVGGYNSVGPDVLGSVEVYDPIENSWNYVAPLDISRSRLGCAALGGKLYAVGGRTTTAPTSCVNTVQVYDPIENSWNDVTPMGVPRGGVGCAALGGKLYAVGGGGCPTHRR